nr:hypothetical protein [Xanthomonadaceae bacterium]
MWLIREIVEIVLFVVQEVYKVLTSSPDLEALEKGIYRAMNEATRRLLEAACRHLDEQLLEQRDKRRLETIHKKARTVLTPFGAVTIERRYYADRETGQGVFLLDEALGLESRRRLSPRLEALCRRLAPRLPLHPRGAGPRGVGGGGGPARGGEGGGGGPPGGGRGGGGPRFWTPRAPGATPAGGPPGPPAPCPAQEWSSGGVRAAARTARSRCKRYRPLPMMMAAPTQVTASGRVRHSSQSQAITQTRPVYSSGAISEASPRLKAAVRAIWPSAPISPTPSTSGRCARANGTQSGIAISPAPMAMIARNQTTMDCGVSVRVSRLTVTAATA